MNNGEILVTFNPDLIDSEDDRLKNRIAKLEAALRDIIADCESNWISVQMIAGIARKALKEGV